jgi:hypothetical protein
MNNDQRHTTDIYTIANYYSKLPSQNRTYLPVTVHNYQIATINAAYPT